MTVVVGPSLDTFIAERELIGQHEVGIVCDYKLGKGLPLSQKRCNSCMMLSSLIDLNSSWTQRIDTGRLTGRTIEVAENLGVRSVKDAEITWKLYKECDLAQREAQQCVLRRYYTSFTCAGRHCTLREVTYTSPNGASLRQMIAQIIELFEGLPPAFVHGNPTVASLSFLGRLPVPLRHTFPFKYSSRHLLQVDFGGADSAALTNAGVILASRGITSADAITVTGDTITVKSDATFPFFLREYPRHAKIIGRHLLMRGLLSLYPIEDTKKYHEKGGSTAKNLREAFEELKGETVPTAFTLPSE